MLSGNIWSTNEFDGVQRPNLAQYVDFKVFAFKGAPADRHNPFLDMNPSDRRAMPIPNAVLNDSALTDIVYLGLDDQNNAHNGPLAVADANAMQALQAFGSLKSGLRRLFILLFDEAFGNEYPGQPCFCRRGREQHPAEADPFRDRALRARAVPG